MVRVGLANSRRWDPSQTMSPPQNQRNTNLHVVARHSGSRQWAHGTRKPLHRNCQTPAPNVVCSCTEPFPMVAPNLLGICNDLWTRLQQNGCRLAPSTATNLFVVAPELAPNCLHWISKSTNMRCVETRRELRTEKIRFRQFGT